MGSFTRRPNNRPLWSGMLISTLACLTVAGCPLSGANDFGAGGTTPAPAGGSNTPPPAATPPPTSTPDANDARCAGATEAAAWRAEVLDRVNQERLRAGLNPVTRNATLEAQADAYACELITYDYFDHVNPVTGSTLGQRADQFGYSYAFIGENLAAGQRTPEQAMDDWMNSPGHRANILEPRFTELGVGIQLGGSYGRYWVQVFGEPR